MKLPKLSTIMERLTPRQLLLACGVVALLIFLLIYFTLTKLTAPKPQPQQPKPVTQTQQIRDVKVVTAKTSIPERTLIKEEMLSLTTMPSNKVPNGALMRTTDLVGRPSKVAIGAGEVITTQKVFASIMDMGLSGRIPPECRAITVGISDVTGVAGFAQPGDYVDVMLVSSQVENNKVVSEMILQNVLLLAINKQVENGGNAPTQNNANAKGQNATVTGQPKVTGNPAMATMALLPEDALKLAAKAQLGQIYLVLRPYRPANGVSDDTYYSVTKASGKMPVTPPPAGTIPPGADIDTSPTANVQIIRGTTTTVGR
ncbi:MAG: Flp pilus assembly protein CpaB [Acidaminococcaceae bacterium]|nr:Flp pilus assembly protein CpaB [Acidaminococcaceae bacterium]